MSPRERFAVRYPGVFFLDKNRVAELSDYLTELDWLRDGEYIESAERAGEGNMNCTLRVATSQRSLIVKQARPWVEKYPAIATFSARASVEFDLGVMLAHCYLPRQPDSVIDNTRDLDGAVRSLDVRLAKQFAGAEITRRLMGVSQLPLAPNIQLKEMLLELSRSLVLS